MTTRKVIAMFILALIPAMTMTAQSIQGKWKMAEESKKVLDIEDEETNANLIFTFTDTEMEMAAQFDYADDEVGTIGFEVTDPGKYSIEDNTLKLLFNHPEASAQIYKLEFSKELKTAMEASDEVKSLLITTITQEFEKNKDQLLAGVKMIGEGLSTFKITDLNDTTLTLQFGEDKQLILNKIE